MRKFLLSLLALLLAAVAAFAGDTIGGGEGGAINLPGGRNNFNNQSSGGGGNGPSAEWTVPGRYNLLLRLPENMPRAVGLLRAYDLPFAETLAPVDGVLTVTLATLATLRGSGEAGFSLDLVDLDGLTLRVDVAFRADGQLQVSAR